MILKCGNRTKACLATVLAHGLFLLTWHCALVNAQQLSIRHYDVGNGLAHSQVTSIFQDRKGYLWFGTFEGLSRFDGYRFTNYSTADGLGHLIISAVAEDRQGHLCVGTLGGGVACLLDDPQDDPSLQGNAQRSTTRKKFLSFQVNNSGNHVSEMLLDKDDSIWCIADGGIYHGVADRDGKLKFTLVVRQMSGSHSAALADRQGQLWFGEGRELVEIIDGQVIKHRWGGSLGTPAALNTIPRPSDPEITAIAEDHEGRLFITNRRELFEFTAPTTDGKGREQWRKLALTLAAGEEIFSMIGDAIDGLWIGTQKGLIRYSHGGQTSIAKTQASSGGQINALAQDREGNLWIGTEANGAHKLSKEIIVSYTNAEGLPDQNVGQVFEDREGRVYALTNSDGLLEIVAGRAVPVPGTQSPPFNTIRVLLDSRDDWWVWPGGRNNLFRFHGLKPQFKNGEEISVDRGNQVSHWGPVPAIPPTMLLGAPSAMPMPSNVFPSARVVGGADLAQGQQSLANVFVQRPEFLAKYPANLDGSSFIDAVLNTIKTDLGVDLAAQKPGLLTLFNSGGRGAVMYRLADDNAQTNPVNNRAFIDAEYNRAFVATQYFGYLRRDSDIGGFLFWLGQVSSGPLRDVPKQHAMVCSFITSAEYQLRFSAVVTHTNADCPQ